jgi:hypothetical protein
VILVGLFAAVYPTQAGAQSAGWTAVDNPYQEDIEYEIGDVVNPRVSVDSVRWHSFTIVEPDEIPSGDDTAVDSEIIVEFENRASSSAKILVIFLLEDADGNPLDRFEVRPFKAPTGRLKERKQDIVLTGATLRAAERVYLFFEVLD